MTDISDANRPVPTAPACVLPHADVQRFLLETLDNAQYPGRVAEFVSQIKRLIREAQITNK